jgi:alanine racemase
MQKRPCWVEIATRALESNYRLLADANPSIALLAIVKANAYGHGLSLCAPAAVRAGAGWLGVTSVEEGIAARTVCPHAEILVISGPFPGQGSAVLEHRLTPAVWEPWQLDELESAGATSESPIPVHLELDTGMSRQGVSPDNLDAILARFKQHSTLRLDGLMTHLYAADESDGEATREQLAQLETMVTRILTHIGAAGLQPSVLHVGNSAALLTGELTSQLTKLCAHHNLKPIARPGLALYGHAPEFLPHEPAAAAAIRARLQPVLTWKTRVVSVRDLTPGQVVGYNGTFVATEPIRAALLAVGYADGLNRALSNRGSVLIHGQHAPIIGRISMDQTVVDVTDIPAAAPGDEAVLLGSQQQSSISAEEHARLANTIPWEIFTSIAARVERVEAR